MKIAVVDDESHWLQKVSEQIEKYFSDNRAEIYTFNNAEAFLDACPQVDLIIADIEMGEINGLQMMKIYRERMGEVALIVLTSHSELAEFGYWVNAKRFISKNSIESRLPEAFSAVEEELGTKAKSQEFDLLKYGRTKIKLDSIMYFETIDRKASIHMENGRDFLCKDKISVIEGMLENTTFVRCHRSYIVNMKWIKDIEKDTIILLDDQEILLSSIKYAELKRRYIKFLFDSAKM